MIEVLLCVVFLIIAGILVISPLDDYRVGIVGGLGLVSGFVVMVIKAVQGSRRRKLGHNTPDAGHPAHVGDKR